MNKKIFFLILVMCFSSYSAYYFSTLQNEQISPTSQSQPINNSENDKSSTDSVQEFDKTKYSIDDTGSLWLVVNKQRPIPSNYKPELSVPSVKLRLSSSDQQMQLATVAVESLNAMFNDAKSNGINLVFGSGYRSYALQKSFYDSYVARDGQAAADLYSARPGTSEHQTGLSFDATNQEQSCHLEICFEDTTEGKWLAAHAHEYGFILRYKKDRESITGYQYEPWHFRYVGKELSTELQKTDQTMEEFFELVNN